MTPSSNHQDATATRARNLRQHLQQQQYTLTNNTPLDLELLQHYDRRLMFVCDETVCDKDFPLTRPSMPYFI